ncbi:hypothetical protein CASFOL_020798 [Castilleja foliolosa]|uniref:Uncharacterized protein n=1 Tax=Castilleja foliolosa TaxID=1961234 RepID=A0ABD3D5I3_9LAMI
MVLSNVNAAVRGGGHHNGCSPEMLRLRSVRIRDWITVSGVM